MRWFRFLSPDRPNPWKRRSKDGSIFSMTDRKIRVFATTDIGNAALDRLRELGYEVEVYPHTDAPPKSVILEKVRGGIDALITTLRDRLDEDAFPDGAGTLKIVAQIAVGLDKIECAAANRHPVPFAHRADGL